MPPKKTKHPNGYTIFEANDGDEDEDALEEVVLIAKKPRKGRSKLIYKQVPAPKQSRSRSTPPNTPIPSKNQSAPVDGSPCSVQGNLPTLPEENEESYITIPSRTTVGHFAF